MVDSAAAVKGLNTTLGDLAFFDVMSDKTKKHLNLSVIFRSRVLTDVVNSTSAEFAIKLLGSESSEVMNSKGPEVQDVIPREGVSLLDNHHFGAH